MDGVRNVHTRRRNHIHEGEEKVETISDEQARTKGFRDNQGFFLVNGTLYRTTTITRVHFVCFTVSAISLLICLCRTALLLTDNLTALFETVHWVTILLTVLSAVPCSFPNAQRYNRIFTSFGKGVYTYSAADEETTKEMKALRDKGEQEKRFIIKLFTVLLLSTYCSFAVMLPAYSVYMGHFFEPQRSDGVIMGIPCVMWIPAQVEDSKIVIVRTVILLFQGYISGTVIIMVLGQQGSAICIGHTLLYEFKVLALSMKTLERRASRLHREGRPSGNQHPEDMRDYLRQCLKEAMIHHQILMSVAKDYSDLFFIQELALIIGSTAMICLSAVSLVSDIPVASKIVSLIFIGSELGNVFPGCFYGQVLLDSHQLVASALYDSNWTKYSSQIGKHVLVILTRLQRPLSLTAGGFTDVNLYTYAQVVKSSFSYFSLLQALKE